MQAERAHKQTPTETPTPEVAGGSRNPGPSTHTHTANPSQEWRGTSGARTQTHTHPNTPARSGGVQAERAHKYTHSPTAQPGVAGRSRNPSQSAQTHPAHPGQEWRGTSGARAQTHGHPNIPARSGGTQPRPEPKHIHPHCTTPVPRFSAGCARCPDLRHPVAVVAWHLSLCLDCGRRRASLACLVAPRWCAAPRPVWWLWVLRSGFPTQR